MSLVSTLAKVAVGVVIAKGVGSLIQNAQGGTPGQSTRRAPGSADPFGGAHSPDNGARLPGGLENIMTDVLAGTPAQKSAGTSGTSGRVMPGSASSGGLGGLLEELSKGSAPAGRTAPAGGGLDDIIGQLSQGGGLGDLLGGLAGALGGAAATRGSGGGFGDLLNQALRNGGEPDQQPSRDQEAVAGLMLRAMIQAAKSDGRIDETEKKKIVDKLGDASPSDIEFLKQELAAPIDVAGLARQVPKVLAPQVYAVSLMAITLDNQNEAQYLHQLAQGLGLDPQSVNAIHAKLSVQPLYG
ncbi:tellurite resistance TerB family protein [Tabrizicola sp. J26]|uniref:tellurite resistance TerB family protein n=1 Tax=Alitabrizicola rongguiensis TaxID=2909234 RepID=UPI001F34E221|nr:tellurite resistance TerB family protein [Tabrizicola rongguiensis]MCF1708016.1 tellurite resistance TerB family protein [Tabrizicola rongguiensis]